MLSRAEIDQACSVLDLCRRAGLRPRVSGPLASERRIVLGDLPTARVVHAGRWLLCIDRRDLRAAQDGIQDGILDEAQEALRALEILAHAFHDYAARECVRGLFGPGPRAEARVAAPQQPSVTPAAG